MDPRLRRGATIVVWGLALLTAAFSARYLFLPPEHILPPQLLREVAAFLGNNTSRMNLSAGVDVYAMHPLLVRLHVGGGIVALVLGLFQFPAGLRVSRPGLHRVVGRLYLASILLSGSLGLPLAFLSIDSYRPALVGPSFGILAVVWLFVSAMAFQRARERRFDQHRAWMLRSYSLTFAAVTVRLVAAFATMLFRDPLLAVNAGFLSWPFNLVVAELLIRRKARPFPKVAAASAGSLGA